MVAEFVGDDTEGCLRAERAEDVIHEHRVVGDKRVSRTDYHGHSVGRSIVSDNIDATARRITE
jgi:hypothetical protein